MKKFVLCLCAVLASLAAYAANYRVTVTTQQYVEYRDDVGNVVATEKVNGNAMIFQVVADTPKLAEEEALRQCQGACNTGIFVKVAEGIVKNGKLCDKYVKTVPWDATPTMI